MSGNLVLGNSIEFPATTGHGDKSIMLKFRQRFLRQAVFVTAMFGALVTIAGNVPVFRYALER